MTTMRRGSKKITALNKLKAAQTAALASPEDPPASQRTLDRVTKERDELRKKLEAANNENAALKSKLRNVTEKIRETVNPREIFSPASPKTDLADIPEKEILSMLNKLVRIDKNESLEERLEELETRITLVDGELAKLLRLKLKMETELHRLDTCQDLEAMRQGVKNLWLQCCATQLFIKDGHNHTDCIAGKVEKGSSDGKTLHNGIPPAVQINLEPVQISLPDHKLPAETHIRDMQPDLRKLVVQELSLYKGSGQDWRLFARRVGVSEDLVAQWQQMKVKQPMHNVLSVWAASNGATVRMLHRHLVSPQMRCVVLGKRISDMYEVD